MVVQTISIKFYQNFSKIVLLESKVLVFLEEEVYRHL